ncbi:MAG: RagB/SusD family nutrient uptake outer membrane protein [Bacteroidota bacterium]
MKKLIILLSGCVFLFSSCNDLDVFPLSEGSSESWFNSEEQWQMSVANLYKTSYWATSSSYLVTSWWNTDDRSYRSTLLPLAAGTINGQTGYVIAAWNNSYNCIAQANILLSKIDDGAANLSEEKLNEYAANGRFARAAQYSRLIFLFGDVPFYTSILTIDEAFSLSRTDKETILDAIYADFDYAAEYLPETYSSKEYQFATKGAALAMKARTALYNGDYSIARDAAEECINLGIYELFPDYYTLFLNKTKNSVETIFCSAFSIDLNVKFPLNPRHYVVRTHGAWGSSTPSWDLFCSYLCTDGLPIDESPLFDPHVPFKNRDPRCAATIAEFDTEWLGIQYSCHPDTLKVMNYNTGALVDNKQNRAVTQFATYNGLAMKKYIDEDWLDWKADNDVILMRYADVLLMYAEAKIELGEIDNSVLDAINKVRARAYGVDYTETTSYPAVTTMDQSELRKILRTERRVEFAFENDLRLNDITRWRLAEKVLTNPDYGLLEVDDLREKVVNPGLWFLPETPSIDEDGIPDFTSLYNQGFIRLLSTRKFDAAKHYLWPIPSKEILINPNLTQNPGY